MPAFPECEKGCANSIVLEVKNGDGNVIVPDEVQCLISGSYIIKVISPPTNVDMEYFWTINGELQAGNLQEFQILVGAGLSLDVGVSVTMPDCPPLAGFVTLEGCSTNCDQDLILEVKNANDVILDPSTCVENGDYTVTVSSPTGGNWTYKWVINGNLDIQTNLPQHSFTVNSNETINIAVTAEAAGCANKTTDISLAGCSNGGGGNGGGGIFSCDGLLIAAISFLIIAGIALIIGTCANNPIAIGVSIGAGIIGAVLLGLWFWFCKKTTSCSVLDNIRCLLNWLVLLAFIFAIVSAFTGAIPCGLAAAVTGVSWGVLSNLLTDVMVNKECEITSCII